MTNTDERLFDGYEDDDDDDFDEEEFADEGFNAAALSFAPPILPENGALRSSAATIPIHERKLAAFDESRRLFQRLWTDEDEIVILEGYLEFVTRRGTTHNNYQHDTGPFYEQIKNKVQVEFNKNQLIEKIRRLKRKYRTVDGRMKAMGENFAFKSAHEMATYEISKQIWSSTFKRPRKRCNNNNNNNSERSSFYGNNGFKDDEIRRPQPMPTKLPAAAAQSCPVSVSSIVEETVKCCLSPLFKELVQHGIGGASGLNSLPFSLTTGLGDLPNGLDGEKWKEQQILELEVYLKRVELLEEHIKATLEELRSSSSSSSMKVDG